MINSRGLSKIALVLGEHFDFEEIEQFDIDAVTIISSVSHLFLLKDFGYKTISLPDYPDEPDFYPGLEDVLKDFDLVIVKGRTDIFCYQALKAKNQYGYHLVLWVDNLLPFVGEEFKKTKTIRQEVSNGSDGFFVQSKDAYEALILEGVHSDRIMYVTPSVSLHFDAKKIEDSRRSFGFISSDFVIGFLGLVEWDECIYDLIYGLKYLFLAKPHLSEKIKVLILGGGSLSSIVREKSISLGLENNIVYSSLSKLSREIFFHSVNVVFSTQKMTKNSIFGSPFRLLCPMSLKIPIISTRTPLSQDLLGKHRFDYCQGNPSSLALAIEKSFSEKNLRNDISIKNFDKINQRFSLDKTKSDFCDFYDSIFKKETKTNYSSSSEVLVEIEKQIKSKQYVSASKLIDHAFSDFSLNAHEQSVLFRLTGDCFLKLGDKNSSKNAYLKSIDLDHFCHKSHIGIGTISIMNEHYEVAVVHFQKAISLSPKDDLGYLGLGLSFQGLEEYNESIRWIKKSLDINPNSTSALYSLIRVSYDAEIFDQAEICLKRYLELHPEDHNMRYALAGILFKLDKFEDVVFSIHHILNFNPEDQRAVALLKQARKKMDFLRNVR